MKDVFVNGIMLENELIGYFLEKLTKLFNGSKANRVLEKLGNDEIDLKVLLEDDIGNTKEMKELQKKVEKLQVDLKKKSDSYSRIYKDMTDYKNDNWKLRDENKEYLGALRHYEDTLAGLKLRHEILNRKDLGKIFNDDEEEEGWTY
jgi:predicted  nucleic acid-binding Zn-ribbon protein